MLQYGTSLPEIFITITSALEGHSNLIIGNAIGSCLCNFLLVLGITSIISPVNIDKRIAKNHLSLGIASAVLILLLGNFNSNTITQAQGFLLILCSVAYLVFTLFEEIKMKNNKLDEEIINEVKSKDKYSTGLIILYSIFGILGLKFGADFVVDNSVIVATNLGLSESFIGMTIVAIGTALPEIITGIISARKGETDLLIGNITGSNILNLCLLIGLGAVISPLSFSKEFNISLVLFIFITVVIQLLANNSNGKINRKIGISLIFIYLVYLFAMI